MVRVVRLVSSGAMKIGVKRQQWICRARTFLARSLVRKILGDLVGRSPQGGHNKVN